MVIAIQNFAFAEHSAVMLLTVQGIVFVGSLFGLGGLAEWLGYQKFYLIGLSCVSGALFALALLKEALGLWPASALLGLGLGILHIANFMSFAKVGEATEMTKVSPILALVWTYRRSFRWCDRHGVWIQCRSAMVIPADCYRICRHGNLHQFQSTILTFIQSDTSHTTQQPEGSKS